MDNKVMFVIEPEAPEGDTLVVSFYPEVLAAGEDTLPFLQKTVGGYVEKITLSLPEGGSVDMWLNDEGKLHGLPRNGLAESIATATGWSGEEYGDWIAGPVVIAGFDAETGETVTTPRDWQMLMHTLYLQMQERESE